MVEMRCISLNLYIPLKQVGAMLAGGKRLSPTVADSGAGFTCPPVIFAFMMLNFDKKSPPCLKEGGPSQTVGGFNKTTVADSGDGACSSR